MSRVAKAPVDLASGVEISISGQEVTIKGKNGCCLNLSGCQSPENVKLDFIKKS